MPIEPLILSYGVANAEFTVRCQQIQKLPSFFIGEKSNAYAGNLRDSRTGERRRWSARTVHIDTDIEAMIQALCKFGTTIPVGGEPFFSGKNVIVSPTNIGDTLVWVRPNMGQGGSVIADPKGGNNATTLTANTANATLVQSLADGASVSRRSGAFLRRRTGTGTVQIKPSDTGGYSNIDTLSGTWKRHVFPSAVSVKRFVELRITVSGDAVDIYDPFLQGDPVMCSIDINRSEEVTGNGVFEMDLTISEV